MMKAAAGTAARDQHNSTNNRTSKHHNSSTSRLHPPRTTRDEWFVTTACTRTKRSNIRKTATQEKKDGWRNHMAAAAQGYATVRAQNLRDSMSCTSRRVQQQQYHDSTKQWSNRWHNDVCDLLNFFHQHHKFIYPWFHGPKPVVCRLCACLRYQQACRCALHKDQSRLPTRCPTAKTRITPVRVC